ncbi:unnamed protein product [Cochlearia groenlandica]
MNHLVIDLSSDEEEDDEGNNLFVDYSDWFDGISDTKPKSNPTVEDYDDEDCVVLDYDPYKITTEKATSNDSHDSDEVVVLGQKGEIACRDYPHPRHDCAKYPFKSTSHQNYCDMCHCYVCDIRAPCVHWCVSFSSTDHCHANDREQIWKNQRESLRTGKLLPCPVSKPCLTAPRVQHVSQPRSIPLPQNPSSPVNKFGVRPCSTPARVGTQPNTYTRPGYRTEQPRTAQQPPGFESRSYIGKPSPLGVSPNSFKCTRRPSGGVYRTDNSKQNTAQRSQYTRSVPPPTPIQGSQQRIVTSSISHVHESQNKVYDKHNSKPNNAQGSQYTRNAPPTPIEGSQQRIVTGSILHVPESQTKVYDKHNSKPNNVQSSQYTRNAPPPTPIEGSQQRIDTGYILHVPESQTNVYDKHNSKPNNVQSSQYTRNAPPSPTPIQGSQQNIVTGYISTVPESQDKVFDKHFNQNMYSGYVQTSAAQSAATVPSSISHPPANQQQQNQSGINTNKALSEFEDWLMDNATTLPGPVCPLSGQDNATTLVFDLESLLQ